MGQFEVPVNPDPRQRYAGLGSRAFAYAVDGILLGVLSPLVTRKCLATGNWRFVLGVTLAWSIAVFLYRPVLHALAGATLGKWVAGIRLVAPDGLRPGLLRALVREVLFLPSLVYSLVASFSVITSASPVLTGAAYRNAYHAFYYGSCLWLTVAFQAMAVLILAAQMISILRSPRCMALHDRIAGTVVLLGRR